MKKVFQMIYIAILATVTAVSYVIFIFPNKFAPAGIDGICTMIQDMTGISMGYLSLVVNIPLLILAYFKLNRDFAVKSVLFILSFSIVVAFLSEMDLKGFYYYTESNTSIVLAPIAAGVIRGMVYAMTISLNGSSGGLDIIASLIRKKWPYFNFMNVIFTLNLGIVISSYFVYGHQMEPVICGILYFYLTSQTSSHIQLSAKENVKIEIITSDAKRLCEQITDRLHLCATILDCHGAYSGNKHKMVVCIANRKYIPLIKDIICMYPDTVYFESIVRETNTHILH